MLIIKFIILVSIFLSSSYIGILISKRYSNREFELKELKKVLNIIETKIRFTYEPLTDIFEEISKNTISSISEILKSINNKIQSMPVNQAWIEGIQEGKLSINNEDKNIIKGLGKLLRKNRCRRTS